MLLQIDSERLEIDINTILRSYHTTREVYRASYTVVLYHLDRLKSLFQRSAILRAEWSSLEVSRERASLPSLDFQDEVLLEELQAVFSRRRLPHLVVVRQGCELLDLTIYQGHHRIFEGFER